MFTVGDRIKHKQRGTLGTVKAATPTPHVAPDAQALDVIWDDAQASNTGAMPSRPMMCMSVSVEKVENPATTEAERIVQAAIRQAEENFRPLKVNGQPIPPEILNGPPGEFARFCGETDPRVLALLDAEESEPECST